jgi:hypothetical protein
MDIMNKLIFILLVTLSGCATEHDAEISSLRRSYRDQCEQWDKNNGQALFARKEGEENLALQDIMARRCSENPDNCKPPHKPEQLTTLERMWGVSNKTPDLCNK